MVEKMAQWGDVIAVEHIDGVPYKMYTERPRRVEHLLAFCERWKDRIHVVQGEEKVTFADLADKVTAQASHLLSLGIKPGDHVLLLGWNSADWIANFWACLKAGGVPVLGNGWWSQSELQGALELLQPAIILADTHGLAKMPSGWKTGQWIANSQGSIGDEQIQWPNSSDENAPAVVIFTSGTEGRPKAVVLSHRGLLAGLQMLLHVTRRLPHQLDGTPCDIGLHTGPLFHIGGVQTLLRAVVIGGTLVMPRNKFDPAEALELIEQYSVTRWSAVPTMVSRLLEHPDVKTRTLASLRSLTVGGAPVHAELLTRVRGGLPGIEPRIATGYGLSENGGQATAASGAETAARPGSSGKPLSCVEVDFRQRDGLPDGEILLRSPTQMSGYYANQNSPIDAQGWLHTGDIGYLDDAGHLWITGRCKDVIIRGGENISPVSVERALMEIQGIAEAVVFAMPHADLGEEVMAIVVDPQKRTAQELRERLKGELASFAIPSRWRIQAEPLPTNHAGKVDKASLIQHERSLQAAEQAEA
jgi:acyl-CoA synthetase (AMP-forming)/AMP-acid ligase II